ncbi:MAG: hypothetical protein IK014_06100 [Lachnospiraceae bacterium]|nr:hypothetical protein [Lachnospiraceae bacterium]
MDAMGKLFDILIFITVLFMVPVSWAVTASGNMSADAAVMEADNFMAVTEKEESISEAALRKLNESIGGSGGFRLSINVKRDAGKLITMEEIMDEIDAMGEFRLLPFDTVILNIYDRDSVLYTSTRLKKRM